MKNTEFYGKIEKEGGGYQCFRTVYPDPDMPDIELEGSVVDDKNFTDQTDDYRYYALDDLEITVMVNKSNGYWAVLNNDSPDDVLEVPENLPSDEEAVKIAANYIEENKLYDGELGEPTIFYSTTGGDLYQEL